MDATIQFLRDRRQRILDGKINCIPLPYPRLKNWFPGFEKRKYTIWTANQKVGKSKLVDKTVVYESFFYSLEHPDQLRIKILYFTLEAGAQEKLLEFFSHLLYKLDKIRIDPTRLKSTNNEEPISEDILNLLESDKYQYYITKFKETVIYIDDIKNPTGINKYCRDFALKRGNLNFINYDAIDDITGMSVIKQRIDPLNPYTPNDPEEILIMVLDNYSNLTLESGMNIIQNISKMSKYCITLRDQLNFCIHAIQHQAQSQEGIENFKLSKLEPSSDGLADCKSTSRDINMLIGLFNPFKFELKEYYGYDVTKFKNNIRFLKILEDRDNGAGGQVCPLFFDGAVSDFIELPLPEDKQGISNVYNYIDKLRNKISKNFFMKFFNKNKIKYG